MTRSYVGVSFRLTVENLRPFYPRCPCGRAASSRLRAANAALAARAQSRRRRLGAARRLPRARRDPRAVDPAAPCGEGRRPGAVPPRAAGDVERPCAPPGAAPARHRLPRARPDRRRSGRAAGHDLAPRRPAAAHGVRPRRDRPRRARAAPGETFLHQPRLRARPVDVHDAGVARALRGVAGARGVGDESAARARPPQAARGDGRTAAARSARRQTGERVSLPLARTRRHGSVRGAQAAECSRLTKQRLVRRAPVTCASMRWCTAIGLLAVAVVVIAAGTARAESRPWLWQCEQIGRLDAQWRCYVRLLLEDIDRADSPAAELPRIDRRARAAGTSLEGSCHALMHEVGRRYGAEHHVTLARLMDYIPRSNDPTCSAGFGMGLVMYLGPQIIVSGGRSALAQCLRLPTRYRSYTCVHGIGHALMRAYHGRLRQSVQSCRKLGTQAPDCAQGAFHDYWISLRGADGTVLRPHGVSPRFLCNGHLCARRAAPAAAVRLRERRGALGSGGSVGANAHLRAARSARCECLPARRRRPGTRAKPPASAVAVRPLRADARRGADRLRALVRSHARARDRRPLSLSGSRMQGRCRADRRAVSDILVVRVYPPTRFARRKGGAEHMKTDLAGTSVRF